MADENPTRKVPEMVERVAKTLHAHNNHADDDSWASRAWLELSEKARYTYRSIARAAIEAMREPTGAMTDKGARYEWTRPSTAGSFNEDFFLYEEEVAKLWQGLIDAALGK